MLQYFIYTNFKAKRNSARVICVAVSFLSLINYTTRPILIMVLYVIYVLNLSGLLISLSNADVYLHNPRGSNNRLNGNGANRQNNNRLFDSQVSLKPDKQLNKNKAIHCLTS